MFICFFNVYWIKPTHFTETKIYFKLDPKAANTAYMILRFIALINLAFTSPDQNLSIFFFATSKLWYHLLTMESSIFRKSSGKF